MAELDSILDRMERINSDVHAAVRRTDKDRNKDLLELRGRFSAETGNLIREISTDQRLSVRPDLAEELSSRLFAIRQKLAAHQAKWRSVSIDENYEEYLLATAAIHGDIASYLRWGRNALATV